VEFAGGGPEGHFGEGAEGPDGVEMTEEEDTGADGAPGAEFELKDVAEVSLFVAFDGSAEAGGPSDNEVGGAVDGGFVVGGGFDFYQLAEAGEEAGFGGGYAGLESIEVHGVKLSRSRKALTRSARSLRTSFPKRWVWSVVTVVKKPQSTE